VAPTALWHSLGPQETQVTASRLKLAVNIFITNEHLTYTTQALRSTIAAPVRAQQLQTRATAPAAAAAADGATSRRQLLSAVALLGAAAASPPAQPAQAAATCDLTSSPSGLQFCDIREGEGPEPAKGSLIRCGDTMRTIT
jgi:FKBP-type peptidyl-prolyl cis-trans isomerase